AGHARDVLNLLEDASLPVDILNGDSGQGFQDGSREDGCAAAAARDRQSDEEIGTGLRDGREWRLVDERRKLLHACQAATEQESEQDDRSPAAPHHCALTLNATRFVSRIGILNNLFYGLELYRSTGRDVKFLLMDEKPSVVPVGSAGEHSVGAQEVPYGRRSLELRARGTVGLGWQAVSAPQIVWNRSTRRAGERGGARVGWQAQMAEDLDDHRRIFDRGGEGDKWGQ